MRTTCHPRGDDVVFAYRRSSAYRELGLKRIVESIDRSGEAGWASNSVKGSTRAARREARARQRCSFGSVQGESYLLVIRINKALATLRGKACTAGGGGELPGMSYENVPWCLETATISGASPGEAAF